MTEDDEFRHFVYLLDETLDLSNVGLISTNMAELLVKASIKLSYRDCAAKASEMKGQTISAIGVWNVIQALSEKEKALTEEHRKGHLKGRKEFSFYLKKQMVYI